VDRKRVEPAADSTVTTGASFQPGTGGARLQADPAQAEITRLVGFGRQAGRPPAAHRPGHLFLAETRPRASRVSQSAAAGSESGLKRPADSPGEGVAGGMRVADLDDVDVFGGLGTFEGPQFFEK